MKKIAIIFLIMVVFSANLFALTADKDWMHLTQTVSKKVTGSWGKTSTVKQKLKDNSRGVQALGIGVGTGYPNSNAVLRYRHSDNHLRVWGNVGFNYGNSVAASLVGVKYASKGIDIDLLGEYGFSIYIGKKKEKEKLWYLDIMPTIGLGLHVPLDDPQNPTDYYAFIMDAGLAISCDLPYSSLPLTIYARGLYKPMIPFISNHNIEIVHGFGAEVGVVFNFLEFKQSSSKTSTKTTTTKSTTKTTTTKPATTTKKPATTTKKSTTTNKNTKSNNTKKKTTQKSSNTKKSTTTKKTTKKK